MDKLKLREVIDNKESALITNNRVHPVTVNLTKNMIEIINREAERINVSGHAIANLFLDEGVHSWLKKRCKQ